MTTNDQMVENVGPENKTPFVQLENAGPGWKMKDEINMTCILFVMNAISFRVALCSIVNSCNNDRLTAFDPGQPG